MNGRGISRGFTLIEIIMTVMIVSLVTVGSLYLLPQVLKNTFYLPNQVQADMVAASALETLVEGDASVRGLRFSRQITTAGSNTVAFEDQDGEAVQFRLDVGAGLLYRRVAEGPEEIVPYFMPPAMTFEGIDGRLFSYYDASDLSTADAAAVRRIDIHLRAKDGAGSFDAMEGRSRQSTCIKVNRYA
ncbi:MAG: type II secretion system GspH family protein [Candidatus Omnitrophica bacterium]|nr:type II secretion system GspH family protein [Candidatus Omnitrophota bacterium]